MPLQLRMLEIKDRSDTHAGNAEIIQHEPTFVIGDPINHLRDGQYPTHVDTEWLGRDNL